MLQCVKPSSHVIQKYTKFAIFTGLYFRHFTIFSDQTSQFYYQDHCKGYIFLFDLCLILTIARHLRRSYLTVMKDVLALFM